MELLYRLKINEKKYILNKRKTMMFNFATYDTQIINWNKKDTCEVCAKYDS